MWLADWIREIHGVDGAQGLRGSYSTMLEAARLVRNHGGMHSLVSSRAIAAGLHPVVGKRGDIAIVSIAGDGGEHFGDEAGGILLNGSVALLSQAGLIMPRRDEVNVKAAWGEERRPLLAWRRGG